MSGTSLKPRSFDHTAEEARLLERAGELLDLAQAAGADEAEVCAVRAESVGVRFEQGDLKLTTVDEGTTLGLRVLRGKSQGFASTNQTDADSLRTIAADANSLASISPPDDANVFPSPPPVETSLDLVTPGVADLSITEAVECARELVARTLAVDPRISIDQARLEVQRTSVAVRSTQGVRVAESDAVIGLSLFGMAVDGDDVGGFDYWGDTVRSLSHLDEHVEETIQRFTSAALGNLNAGAAETYHGPVLFSPAAFLDVFISPLVSAASAVAVQRGRSALAGKVGQSVAHESLTITDDPFDRRLAGAASFDREGVPTRRFPLLEAGVLTGLLYNGYAAAVDGRESTGHATGGARSVPGLGCHALSVAPGQGGTPHELRQQLDRGLLVQRFSGSVDPASGDFSGVAKSARWVEDGEEQRSVRETLFSGNAFELLGRLIALSSTSEVVMGSAIAPWALIDGVSVTAG